MAKARSPLGVQITVACLCSLLSCSDGFVVDRQHTASSPLLFSRNAGTFFATNPYSSSALAALVYMPDGTVLKDDDEELQTVISALDSDVFKSDLSRFRVDALLKHLNTKDMRGPLAILSAAHGDINLESIEGVAVRGISSKSVYIEAICSREDMHCVNVPVIIDFPQKCDSDGDILAACNELYRKADAKLERTKVKTGAVVTFNPGRGFGFISLEDGSPDVYVHHSNIKMKGYRTLQTGQTVEFKTGKDTRRGTGREYAYDVVPRKEHTAEASDARDADMSTKEAVPTKVVKPKATKKRAKQRTEKKEDGAKSEGKRLEEALASKAPSKDYATMEVGERAFHVLLDLGLITLTPDPDAPGYDHSKDDEFAEFTTIG